jgi:hypothetical protein
MGADRIVQGQVFPAGTNKYESPGSIIVDAVTGMIQTVNNQRQVITQQSAIAAAGAQTTITAITTAQDLYSKAIAAGILNQVGRTLSVSGWGVYSTAGGTTPTLTFALIFAGVTLCTITTAAINTAANTNLQFQFNFQVTVITTGTTATLEAHGTVSANLSANTPGAALSAFGDQNTAVSSATNLAAAGTLEVTMAASAAVASATLRQVSVEVLS